MQLYTEARHQHNETYLFYYYLCFYMKPFISGSSTTSNEVSIDSIPQPAYQPLVKIRLL